MSHALDALAHLAAAPLTLTGVAFVIAAVARAVLTSVTVLVALFTKDSSRRETAEKISELLLSTSAVSRRANSAARGAKAPRAPIDQ